MISLASPMAGTEDTKVRAFASPTAGLVNTKVRAFASPTAGLVNTKVRAFASPKEELKEKQLPALASPHAKLKKGCLPYRRWENQWYPGTTNEMCPVLTPGVECMAFLIPAGATRVMEWLIQAGAYDQMVLNRAYIKVTNGANQALSSDEVLVDLRDIWRLQVLKDLHTSYRVRWYIMKQVLSSEANKGKWAFTYDKQTRLEANPANDSGAKVGDPLPLFAAMTGQLKTGEIGRSKKGSKRFAPLVEADTEATNANFFTDAVVGNWTGNLLWMKVDFTYDAPGQTGVNVIASPKLLNGEDGQDPAKVQQWCFAITSVAANKRVGSQNSRKTKKELF